MIKRINNKRGIGSMYMKYITINESLIKTDSIIMVSQVKRYNESIDGMRHKPVGHSFEVYLHSGHMIRISDTDKKTVEEARSNICRSMCAIICQGDTAGAKSSIMYDDDTILRKAMFEIRHLIDRHDIVWVTGIIRTAIEEARHRSKQ